MTHLGLVSAVSASEMGFRVVCFDPDAADVAAMAKGELPVAEPQLESLLAKNAGRLSFASEAGKLAACDVVYVAADVPTDEQGKSDLESIIKLLEIVLGATNEETAVVVLSQVPPGFTRASQRPGRKVYYQVETLIFGQAVQRALNPERYIVGCSDPVLPLHEPYAAFLAAGGCPVLAMGYESAELAKISINMCLVASISTANTLAELCEKIGADWSEIVPALKLDRRIGQFAYLVPGLGIAGGNLERDLATVCSLADLNHTDAGIVRAWIASSEHRKSWAARTIRAALLDAHPESVVAVWGLAYKENTRSVKNSPSLATIAQFPGTRFKVHDPLVPAVAAGHPRAESAADPLTAVVDADALMILTPWPQYRAIAPAAIAQAMRGRIVLDPFGVLQPAEAAVAGLRVYSLGRPPAIAEN